LERHAPALDLRQFGFRPLGDHIAAAEIDRAGFAVDRKPIAFADRRPCKLRGAGGRSNRQRRAADDTGLAHLPRDQCGMRGASADGGDDSCRRSEARDVRGRGVGTD
jgi:hypothetical protein